MQKKHTVRPSLAIKCADDLKLKLQNLPSQPVCKIIHLPVLKFNNYQVTTCLLEKSNTLWIY